MKDLQKIMFLEVNGDNLEVSIFKAGEDDTEAIHSLVLNTGKRINDLSVYYYSDDFELTKHFVKQCFSYIAKTATGEIVAALLAIPGNFDYYSILEKARLTCEEKEQTLIILNCVVSDDYRGHDLQKSLVLRAERDARKLGFKQMCGTVSSINYIPLCNMLESNYNLIGEYTYEETSCVRYILSKELRHVCK